MATATKKKPVAKKKAPKPPPQPVHQTVPPMRTREEVSLAIATFQLVLQQAYRMGDQVAFTTSELAIDMLRWFQGHEGVVSRIFSELEAANAHA